MKKYILENNYKNVQIFNNSFPEEKKYTDL